MVNLDFSPARIALLEDELRNLHASLRELSEAVQDYLNDASKTDELDEALAHATKTLRNSPVAMVKRGSMIQVERN